MNYIIRYYKQTYSQRGNLVTHMRRVHMEVDQSNYQCQHCSCSFKKIGSLNAHMTKFHPNVDWNFVKYVFVRVAFKLLKFSILNIGLHRIFFLKLNSQIFLLTENKY